MSHARSRLIARRLELDPPLSQEQLAHRIGIHPKTLSRIERGLSMPHVRTRKKLADMLRWSTAELALALNESDHGDASNGHQMPAHLTHFASLELSATEMRSWAPLMVPGLLQIEQYALAVERTSLSSPTEAAIAQRVELRLSRQAVLTRDPDPLTLYAILDASVLVRTTGGPAVMAAQLDHLAEMDERPNVSIRVAPLDERTFIAPVGAFHLMSGAARTPSLACPTDLMGVQYIENPPSLVEAYVATFAALWERSDELDEVELLSGCR
jgi:DNA-binding XRE family transcriptional regulator